MSNHKFINEGMICGNVNCETLENKGQINGNVTCCNMFFFPNEKERFEEVHHIKAGTVLKSNGITMNFPSGDSVWHGPIDSVEVISGGFKY